MRKIKIFKMIFLMLLFLFISLSCPLFLSKSYATDYPTGTLSRDIDGIEENLYPGFKTMIKNLKNGHSNFTFLVYYTGLDWNEVITAEYQGHGHSPRNLFQKGTKYNGMWICPICCDATFDNGSWSCASREALEYMIDPRNSLNETDLFQFKDLEGADVTVDQIRTVVSQYESFLNNEEAIQAIYQAGCKYNINPFFLVAKIINEHGRSGTVLTAGKGYNGKYVGCYNYFNIGSYGNGTATIINNGLSYAQSHGWTSITASILGGAEVVRSSYIDNYSQNTFYYQKFNVSGRSALASHQYQQNVMAAQTQGTSYKSYYTKIGGQGEYTFIIPLYKNMPKTACVRPDYTKPNSITYSNGKVTSSVNVPVKASPLGMSIGVLNNEESIKIISRAGKQSSDGNFYDIVVSNVDGTYGYAQRYMNGYLAITAINGDGVSQTPATQPENKPAEPAKDSEMVIQGNEIDLIPKLEAQDIIKKYGDKIVIKNTSGEEIKTGKVCTGYTVQMGDKNYTIVKKGDVDGDGEVTVIDAVTMLNVIKGSLTLEGAFLKAAIVESKDNVSFTVIDVVKVLNNIKGNDELCF